MCEGYARLCQVAKFIAHDPAMQKATSLYHGHRFLARLPGVPVPSRPTDGLLATVRYRTNINHRGGAGKRVQRASGEWNERVPPTLWVGGKAQWPSRDYGLSRGRVEIVPGTKGASHEEHGSGSGYCEEHFRATCKSSEFLFHRRRYDLTKPVVPSTVPYPDMRSR